TYTADLSELLIAKSPSHPYRPHFPTRRSSDLNSHLMMRFTPRENLNMVFSIQQTGIPLGAILAALAAPPIAVAWSWQWAVVLLTDRKSTRLNSSHVKISYAVFCLKKKKIIIYI